jgi:hypothetical protein
MDIVEMVLATGEQGDRCLINSMEERLSVSAARRSLIRRRKDDKKAHL